MSFSSCEYLVRMFVSAKALLLAGSVYARSERLGFISRGFGPATIIFEYTRQRSHLSRVS